MVYQSSTISFVRQPPKGFDKYVQYLMQELDLTDWVVALRDRPADDDAHASIVVTYGQRSASLFLSLEFFDLPPEEIRWVLVHELLHIHNNPMMEALESVKTLVGLPVFVAVEANHRLALERANDAVARAFARKLDLPSFGGGK